MCNVLPRWNLIRFLSVGELKSVRVPCWYISSIISLIPTSTTPFTLSFLAQVEHRVPPAPPQQRQGGDGPVLSGHGRWRACSEAPGLQVSNAEYCVFCKVLLCCVYDLIISCTQYICSSGLFLVTIYTTHAPIILPPNSHTYKYFIHNSQTVRTGTAVLRHRLPHN